MAYWLMKSEPDVFGIDDLRRVKVEPWNGVRNYQARNMLRDQMQVDDRAFFYHSNCAVPGIAGIMRIVRSGYADPSALDPTSPYYDPRSFHHTPRWYCVDVCFESCFESIIPLSILKSHPDLQDMALVRKGNRLSVMPITDIQWHTILAMASLTDTMEGLN